MANIKIKVLGVGGAGGNAVSRMRNSKIQGVDLIALNTDAQDLKKLRGIPTKIRIGKSLTGGLGAGMNPEIGKKAAEESRKEIFQILRGSDMVFITAGLGGGTGSGASPVIAEIAKSLGILTAAVVTKPFSFEGPYRAKIAEEGLDHLRGKVDTLIAIPNDRILSFVDQDTTLTNAFLTCDEILHQAVSGISNLILTKGLINLDFADIRAILRNSGSALFGIGKAKGDGRVEKAAKLAISSPLVDFSIKGAKGILFNVSGGKDLSLVDIEKTAKIITKDADPKAKIIFGAVEDNSLPKGEIKITVIATGFET